MRTLRIYTYDELDEAAKQRAIDSCRNKVAERLNDCDSDDYRRSLMTIEDCLGINVRDWEVGYYGRPFFRWDYNRYDYDIEDPRMLCRYLDRVYYNVHKGKYIGWHESKGKAYYSKVLSGTDSFMPNGMWTDGALQDAMEKRFEWVRRGETIEDFIEDLLSKFFDSWQHDWEEASSDESVEDTLANGYSPYEFYEDGSLYN